MNQFVSRGGIKLQAAIENFKLKIKNLICLDVGSSTGGFVDCLLQNGARKVYGVDTSYGELAWKLRNNPRVVVMERTNILYLESLPLSHSGPDPESIKMDPRLRGDDDTKVDIVTIDAGWTRLELVLEAVRKFLKKDGIIIALLKPQYQASPDQLTGGVVKKNQIEKVKNQTIKKIIARGFKIKSKLQSPILGGGGNLEYFLVLTE